MSLGVSRTLRGESISAESLSGRFAVFESIKGSQVGREEGKGKGEDGNSITPRMPRALEWVTMVPVEGPTVRTGENPSC